VIQQRAETRKTFFHTCKMTAKNRSMLTIILNNFMCCLLEYRAYWTTNKSDNVKHPREQNILEKNEEGG